MSDRAQRILAPFEAGKDYMEDRIRSGIEANRKGHVKLSFIHKDGSKPEKVHVELKQKTHDFRFGANCFLLDEMESEEKNAEYKRLFANLFNLATIPFYWCDLEPEQGKPRFAKDSPKIYRRPAPDLCLEFCREHGIEPKLHCLNYDQWTPSWIDPDASVQTVKRYLDRRMQEIAERYRDSIPSMEVINETLCDPRWNMTDAEPRHSTHFFEEPDIVEWSFEHARKYLPFTRLIINEATDFIWGGAFHWNRNAYYMQIERALSKGASIDSIGMQYHMFYRAEDEERRTAKMYDPSILYATMDRFADFRRPLQVTEITIPAYSNAAEDEELQAEIIRNLYRIWFSHANMEAAVYWNLVDGYAAFARQGDMTSGENYFHGALVRFDMTPKPAYKALDQLINREWRTNGAFEGVDHVTVKGFYGDYEAQVTVDGRTLPIAFHIGKGESNQYTFKI